MPNIRIDIHDGNMEKHRILCIEASIFSNTYVCDTLKHHEPYKIQKTTQASNTTTSFFFL